MATKIVLPFTQEVAEARIVECYFNATASELSAGLAWYPFYGQKVVQFGAAYGLDASLSCALFACLSPGTRIQRNWSNFKEACIYRDASHIVQAYAPMKAKAVGVFNDMPLEDIIRGQKVSAFYANLMGNYEPVTVDRHAWALVVNSCQDKKQMNTKEYNGAAQAFIGAARTLAVSPAMVQAVTWVVWRRQKGIVDNGGAVDVAGMIDAETTKAILHARTSQGAVISRANQVAAKGKAHIALVG